MICWREVSRDYGVDAASMFVYSVFKAVIWLALGDMVPKGERGGWLVGVRDIGGGL